MTGETIHLIIRRTAEGLYVTSPQAPGLAYGCSTLAELRSDIDDVLAFHFDQPASFPKIEHHEQHYVLDGRELVIRVANDAQHHERHEVFTRLGQALTVPEQAQPLTEGPTNQVGEVVYVCAVSSDTLGWFADQMDTRGDTAILAVAVGDPFVFTVPFTREDDHPRTAGVAVGGHHHRVDTPIEHIVRSTPIVQPVTVRPSMVA